MKAEIKRLCACGCGGITNYGKKYISGHNSKGKKFSKKHKRKLSLANKGQIPWSKGKKFSKEHKRKLSLAAQNRSREHNLKLALTKIKNNLDYEYCGAWKDKEYRDDLRKDYCENVDCKGIYKRLNNHHINLNKKHCHPSNIMTLCNGCHKTLHWKLGWNADYKDYLTIIRRDRITYIHKGTRQVIATIYIKEESYNVL